MYFHLAFKITVIQFLWMLLNSSYRLSGIEIMGICIGLMLLSEVLLPWLSTQFYFDPVDLMMVGLGGVVYYWGMR
jgi:hypothetical protein